MFNPSEMAGVIVSTGQIGSKFPEFGHKMGSISNLYCAGDKAEAKKAWQEVREEIFEGTQELGLVESVTPGFAIQELDGIFFN